MKKILWKLQQLVWFNQELIMSPSYTEEVLWYHVKDRYLTEKKTVWYCTVGIYTSVGSASACVD